ncbi:hypothetical protein AAIR98_000892 [Elusimicrobium simillimum]|uniref:hypothetical protein n=1 Tax=Elusimicrobium simillimum TaxID=3143438 RepID=UPI003C6EF958
MAKPKKDKAESRKISNKNLIPFTTLPEDEMRELARRGGRKSRDVHRVKKTFKQLTQMLLDRKPPAEIIDRLKEFDPKLDEQELDYRMALLQTQMEQAAKGNPRAFEIIRDTAGEKPIEKQEISGSMSNTNKFDKEELKKAIKEITPILKDL